MDINKMTRKQFNDLPDREWNEDIGTFDSMVLIPLRRLHDSGYRLMDFVAVRNGEPLCKLSGCSDVIHFDGIGGYGDNWFKKYGTVPQSLPARDWNIDCLKVSGYLRIFSQRYNLKAAPALSSFEFYAVEKEKE
jgi:hypothetical protein